MPITAVFAGRTNANTTVLAAGVLSGAPAAPVAGVAGQIAARQAAAAWVHSGAGVSSFRVESAAAPDFAVWTVRGTTDAAARTLLMTGLAPGVEHRFRVVAIGSGGEAVSGNSPTFQTRTLQRGRATADIVAGPWSPSTGTSLFPVVSEATPNDLDFVSATAAGTAKFRLPAFIDPGIDTDQTLTVRGRGDGATPITLAIVQGHPVETPIAAMTFTPGVTVAAHVLAPTPQQAGAITNYADLYYTITRA